MEYISKVLSAIKSQNAWLGGIISFVIPVITLFNYLFLFIIVDMITGIIASKKEGKIITSNCLRRTVTKMLSYFSVILLCHSLDLIMGDMLGDYTIMNIITGLIAFVELISNCENLYRITKLDVFLIITQFSLKKFIELFKVSPKDGQERAN